MRQRCTHCKLVIATKLGDAFDVLEGRAAVQRDTDRLEKWAGQQFQDISTGKCQIWSLGWGHPVQQHHLGPWQRKLLWRKALKVPGGSKLNASQQQRILATVTADCMQGSVFFHSIWHS